MMWNDLQKVSSLPSGLNYRLKPISEITASTSLAANTPKNNHISSQDHTNRFPAHNFHQQKQIKLQTGLQINQLSRMSQNFLQKSFSSLRSQNGNDREENNNGQFMKKQAIYLYIRKYLNSQNDNTMKTKARYGMYRNSSALENRNNGKVRYGDNGVKGRSSNNHNRQSGSNLPALNQKNTKLNKTTSNYHNQTNPQSTSRSFNAVSSLSKQSGSRISQKQPISSRLRVNQMLRRDKQIKNVHTNGHQAHQFKSNSNKKSLKQSKMQTIEEGIQVNTDELMYEQKERNMREQYDKKMDQERVLKEKLERLRHQQEEKRRIQQESLRERQRAEIQRIEEDQRKEEMMRKMKEEIKQEVIEHLYQSKQLSGSEPEEERQQSQKQPQSDFRELQNLQNQLSSYINKVEQSSRYQLDNYKQYIELRDIVDNQMESEKQVKQQAEKIEAGIQCKLGDEQHDKQAQMKQQRQHEAENQFKKLKQSLSLMEVRNQQLEELQKSLSLMQAQKNQLQEQKKLLEQERHILQEQRLKNNQENSTTAHFYNQKLNQLTAELQHQVRQQKFMQEQYQKLSQEKNQQIQRISLQKNNQIIQFEDMKAQYQNQRAEYQSQLIQYQTQRIEHQKQAEQQQRRQQQARRQLQTKIEKEKNRYKSGQLKEMIQKIKQIREKAQLVDTNIDQMQHKTKQLNHKHIHNQETISQKYSTKIQSLNDNLKSTKSNLHKTSTKLSTTLAVNQSLSSELMQLKRQLKVKHEEYQNLIDQRQVQDRERKDKVELGHLVLIQKVKEIQEIKGRLREVRMEMQQKIKQSKEVSEINEKMVNGLKESILQSRNKKHLQRKLNKKAASSHYKQQNTSILSQANQPNRQIPIPPTQQSLINFTHHKSRPIKLLENPSINSQQSDQRQIHVRRSEVNRIEEEEEQLSEDYDQIDYNWRLYGKDRYVQEETQSDSEEQVDGSQINHENYEVDYNDQYNIDLSYPPEQNSYISQLQRQCRIHEDQYDLQRYHDHVELMSNHAHHHSTQTPSHNLITKTNKKQNNPLTQPNQEQPLPSKLNYLH